MATKMEIYLKKALDLKSQKGSRPTKYKIKARWDVLQENNISVLQISSLNFTMASMKKRQMLL